MNRRLCECGCGRTLTGTTRQRFARTACRVSMFRQRRRGVLGLERNAAAPTPARARLALADPPYPGRGHLYPEGVEVNHALLIGSLRAFFDGWALFTDDRSLSMLLKLCPDDVRVMPWTWPGGRHNSRKRWEPVIYCSARRPVVASDHHHQAPPGVPGFMGAKPVELGLHVLGLLGARPGDVCVDLFPGTGRLGRAARQAGLVLQRYADVAVDRNGRGAGDRYDGRGAGPRNEDLETEAS